MSYDPEEIMDVYRKLQKALDLDFGSALEQEKEKACEEIRKAKEIIGDYPIAVDYQAVLRPYSLALMMSRNGFHMGMATTTEAPTRTAATMTEVPIPTVVPITIRLMRTTPEALPQRMPIIKG